MLELDELDLDLSVFDVEDNPQKQNKKIPMEVARVRRHRPPKAVKYEYAREMVSDLGDIKEGDAIYSMVSGRFIAGDIYEAYLKDNNLVADEIIISTLSYSQENIDSLKNIQLQGRVKNLALIVSDYFFSHERNNGIKYAIDELTDNDNFTLSVAGLHTKITLIKTECGKHLVFHGSANLRSSDCIEQIVVENSEQLYYFNRDWMTAIINEYTVKHNKLRGKKLWQVVAQEQKA